jgi:hypothetical protein
MNNITDPADPSAILRASLEDDMIRAVVSRILGLGEGTDKFSAWVLAAAGGFIALQFTVAPTVSPHAPKLMMSAIAVTVASLFIGAMVKLMVYNTEHAATMLGIGTEGAQIQARYETELMEQARASRDSGQPLTPLKPLDMKRISRNCTALVEVKQRWLPHIIFESADKIIGLMAPKRVSKELLDSQF